MRRETLLLGAIPLVNAFSLQNFQSVGTTVVPLNCLLTYAQEIPNCKKADFENPGCSSGCVASLLTVQTSVAQACAGVVVSSRSLLGIIQSGGIIPALCPDLLPTSTVRTTVTLPATSPGLQITTSQRTTPTAQSASTTLNTRTTSSSAVETGADDGLEPSAEPTPEPTPSLTSTLITSTTVQPAVGLGNATPTQERSPASATTSSSNTNAASQKSSSGLDTGGGSPFDINANAGNHITSGLAFAILVAVGAGMFLER